MAKNRGHVAEMYREAGDAFARLPSCVSDPEGFAQGLKLAKELLADADAAAEEEGIG